MRITEMKGKNIDLTEGIKSYVEGKLQAIEKITQKFEPCDLRVDVGKTGKHHKKGDVFTCELSLTIPGTMLRSEVRKDELYAAVDVAVEELRRQVTRYKEKLRDADRVVMDTVIEEHTEEY